jgi:hypothetical protein
MKKRIFMFTAAAAVLFLCSCEKECLCEEQKETKTLTFQPGPEDGQDCLVAYREFDNNLYATSNHNVTTDLVAIRWTYAGDGAGEGTNRSYIKFPGVSQIPQDAVVKSAKLSLYGVNSGVAASLGNSFFPGSPYEGYGDNKCWLKKVTEDWVESMITWNNKPGTVDANQVEIPASTSQWGYSVTDLDVTQLVREMVSTGKNYGFCMQLQNEEIYRSMIFATSENQDSNKRPKLVVEYETN